MRHIMTLPQFPLYISTANSRGPTARGRGADNDFFCEPGCHGHACVAMQRASRAAGRRTCPRQAWAWHPSLLSAVFAMLIASLFLSGCTPSSPADAVPARQARSEVERGPVRVTAEVTPAKASLSDEPLLTLTIDSEEGVVVEKPPFGSTLGGFKIRGLREPLRKIQNGREVIQQIYTLEPTETGRLRIAPIAVAFFDRRPKADGRRQTVVTEPITVEITSLLGDKSPALGDLRGPAGPMAIPSHLAAWLWAMLPVVVVALVAGWWLSRRRRREKAVAAVVLTPEQLANMELDKLVASGLADRDIKQFYVELTSIVRRYIERTTGIRAPEETTEEFLREISRAGSRVFAETTGIGGVDDGRLPSPPAPLPKGEGSLFEECSRLRDFLESADLVKFAAHEPRFEDTVESVRRAKLFITAKIVTTP